MNTAPATYGGAGAPMVPNVLVTGSSGSGKTEYIRRLLKRLEGKYRFLVVLNTTDQLGEFCKKRFEVDSDLAAKPFSAKKLEHLIRFYKSVHFECSFDEDEQGARDFLQSLGTAIRGLGVKDTRYLEVLVVVDECQRFLAKRVIQRAWKILETEGRKFGIGIVKATQQLASTDADTIAPVVRRQTRFVVVFPLSDEAERSRIMRLFSGLPDPGTLAFPDRARNLAPEYIAFDRMATRAVRMTRGSNGRVSPVHIQGLRTVNA